MVTRSPAAGRRAHIWGRRRASDLSRTIFNVAVGLIAVHVVDDSFVQPQPGTSAGDHVFSGLVPLAILGLAAWAYPRVRSGAQATIALSLVPAAALSGIEGIYYGAKTGLSGDDYEPAGDGGGTRAAGIGR